VLTLTVLGCTGSYPGPGGACSGYLLSSGTTQVWMDCGSGTLANLQHHIGLTDLTGIVVSHAHPDHCGELPLVHVAFRHYVERLDVPVFGTAETRERVEALRGSPLAPAFDWHTITDGSVFEIGALRFTASETDHPVETLALRVDDLEEGRTLAYSADTSADWTLDALGDGIDVALCEATLGHDPSGSALHLSAREAGESARFAGAGRLVITHLAPGRDSRRAQQEAAEAFGAAVEVAANHSRIEV